MDRAFFFLRPTLRHLVALVFASITLWSGAAHAASDGLTISAWGYRVVTAGQSYSFTPTTQNPSGRKLVFSIANKPVWASFSSSTGQLSGTPSLAYAPGWYGGIVISVSDGVSTATGSVFGIATQRPDTYPPTISGAPPTAVNVSTPYLFQPAAKDPAGNPVWFGVTNKPSWASFSRTTGQLSGTPTAANVGTYSNIVISVSDGQQSASLPAFSIQVKGGSTGPVNPTVSLNATPGSVSKGSASTLSWSATNATSCAASGDWSGSKAMSGTWSTGALSTNTSYTLTCNGASGTSPATKSATVAVSTTSGSGASFNGTWFAPNSVWNTPIPGNAVIEPNSAAIMAHYVSVYGSMWGFSVSTDTWTPAVIEAPASAPTTSVTFTQVGTWTMSKIPVTSDVFAAADYFKSQGDTDSSICLYSDADGVFFNFWAFYDTGGGTFTVGTGSVFPINGPGWWNNSQDPWAGAAAGGSYCGGLIRPSEWAAGKINHALQGAMPFEFNLTGSINGFIFPATTSDGAATNTAQAMPEGALLQLDPTLTDAQLLALGVPSADLPICHAMQIYGWYDNDSSATTFPATIRFQSGLGKGSTLYPGAAPLPIAIFNHMRWVAPPSPSSVPPNNNHTSASAYMVSP